MSECADADLCVGSRCGPCIVSEGGGVGEELQGELRALELPRRALAPLPPHRQPDGQGVRAREAPRVCL
eukprot:3742533-Rhodomonas_salina.1